MAKKVKNEEMAKKVSSHKLEMEAKPQMSKAENANAKAKSDWGSDSYAYAVKNTLEESRHMKGSQSSFLGKEKQILNPKEYVDSEMMHKCGKKKE